MSFKDLALPLVARGIRVIPCQSLAKHTYVKGGPERGSLDVERVHAWDLENPDYNVGCLGTVDGLAIFDCDVKGLITQIEKETGNKIPPTFTVKSANKGTAHLYFKQTERSRALGNKTHRAGEVRGDNQYVVGPGSMIVCDDGTKRTYEIWRDVAPADFPDFLVDWVNANPGGASSTGTGVLDGNVFGKLKGKYLENLDPKDMYGIKGLFIDSLHPLLMALAAILHDGERTVDEIEEILDRVGREYGHREPLPKDTRSVAEWIVKQRPVHFEPENLPPSYICGSRIFPSDEARALFKERVAQTPAWASEYFTAAEAEFWGDGRVANTDYEAWKANQPPEPPANWFFDADSFMQEKLPLRSVLASDENGTPVLFASSVNQIFAPTGQGKSMFVHGLTKLCIKGGEFLRYRSPGGFKVLLADGELPSAQLQERLQKLIGPSSGKLALMSPERMPGHTFPKLSDPQWQEEFMKRLDLLKPDVIVFDTLTACFRFDTNDGDIWMQVNQFFISLRIKGYCVIIIHHAGKSGSQRGRTDGDDNLDLSIKLDRPKDWAPGDGCEFTLNYSKVRAGGHLPNFQAKYDDSNGKWEMGSATEDCETLKMLKAGKSVRTIAQALDVSKNTIWRIRKKAQERGELLPPPTVTRFEKDGATTEVRV